MKHIFNNRGVSLLEVLVTMGIITVLAGVAVPAYNQYKGNVKRSAIQSDAANGRKAYLAYDAVNNSYCVSLSSAGLAGAGQADIYRSADAAFYGFSGTCGSLTNADLKADIKKSSTPATPVPDMNASTCNIANNSFTLAAGIDNGDEKIGYLIGHNDSGPRASKTPGTCTKSGSAACSATSATSETNCTGSGNTVDAANCQWNAGAIADLCDPAT